MRDPVVVVSRRTGRKLEVPRARFERNPHLFKLPPRARRRVEPQEPQVIVDETTDEGGR